MNSFIRKPFKYTYKNVCAVLILINIITFAIFSFFRMLRLWQLENYFALIPPLIIHKKMFWQVFTYQFLHGDIWHLFFNMLPLILFGIPLERKMGSKEFLLFYLLCGTLCGISALIIYYLTYLKTGVIVVAIGSSGTVFSIMLTFAVLYPSSTIFIWGILPIPAPILILSYAILELFNALFVNDGVAHSIHFFGLLWAALYIKIRFGINPTSMWKNIFR